MADRFDKYEGFHVGAGFTNYQVALNPTAADPDVAVPWTIGGSSLAGEFIGRFDPTRIPPVRVTKVVVLSQEPGPDMFLPAGTPVNLVMAIKEDLPVVSFNNIETVVTAKYPLVGTLIEDLGKNDAAAQAAKPVLDQKSQLNYEDLPPQDANAVNAFIKSRFNIDPSVPANIDQVKKVYDNLRFLNSF